MAAAGTAGQYIKKYERQSDSEWEGEEPAVADWTLQLDVLE